MKTIAFLNDIHLDETEPLEHGIRPQENWKRLLDHIAHHHVDNIVFGGDIGGKNAYPWFFASLKPWGKNFHLLIGNHDNYDEAIKYYPSVNSELYYAYEDGHVKYIALDSSTSWISTTQLTWLKAELSTPKKILIFIHHPILEVDTPVDRVYPLKNREQVRDLLLTLPNPIHIFCAHYHMSDVQTQHNLTQYITPAASYQIKKQARDIEVDNSNYGYRLISIDEDRINSRIILLNNLN
ncbi:metallophosphoesterase family protein [Mucilaginibacter terrae]|uniref:Icc protein n=1 Tax=Mucilaginibacter terrae TaxID=1955052 RepID=A0ABU3GV54_9SPHI|nr:metallophosphoesterase [Mucilaginibacter terrae]MDT3403654.1 Icc protein [Mucilaginibacter terrae]